MTNQIVNSGAPQSWALFSSDREDSSIWVSVFYSKVFSTPAPLIESGAIPRLSERITHPRDESGERVATRSKRVKASDFKQSRMAIEKSELLRVVENVSSAKQAEIARAVATALEIPDHQAMKILLPIYLRDRIKISQIADYIIKYTRFVDPEIIYKILTEAVVKNKAEIVNRILHSINQSVSPKMAELMLIKIVGSNISETSSELYQQALTSAEKSFPELAVELKTIRKMHREAERHKAKELTPEKCEELLWTSFIKNDKKMFDAILERKELPLEMIDRVMKKIDQHLTKHLEIQNLTYDVGGERIDSVPILFGFEDACY